MRADEQAEPGREAILAALERHDVEYVVIGGAAAQARGWPEPTEDLDVTPERSKENLSRLADALEELGAGVPRRHTPLPRWLPASGGHRLAHVPQPDLRRVHHTARHLDIVLRPDGTDGYEQLVATATRERLTGTEIVVPVASAEMLLHSKSDADRPKDQRVLDRMREILNPLSQREGHEPWSPREGRERARGGHEPPER